jgi:hypothetical protein
VESRFKTTARKKTQKQKEDYLGRRRGLVRGEGAQKKKMEREYNRSTLYTCMNMHNETHYFI